MERNETKPGFRFVAFDLDGTICNTLKDIASSLNRALAACGFPTYSDEGVVCGSLTEKSSGKK